MSIVDTKKSHLLKYLFTIPEGTRKSCRRRNSIDICKVNEKGKLKPKEELKILPIKEVP